MNKNIKDAILKKSESKRNWDNDANYDLVVILLGILESTEIYLPTKVRLKIATKLETLSVDEEI